MCLQSLSLLLIFGEHLLCVEDLSLTPGAGVLVLCLPLDGLGVEHKCGSVSNTCLTMDRKKESGLGYVLS